MKDAQQETAASPAPEAEAQGGTPAGLFSQEQVEGMIRERMEREKSLREKAAARAREEGEAEALRKNQEWQALAEKNAARLAELEPLEEQVAQYRGALEKALAAEKKDLPRHLLALLEKLDPLEQLAYLADQREELGRPAARTGVPASPEPGERAPDGEAAERARRSQAQLYQNF